MTENEEALKVVLIICPIFLLFFPWDANQWWLLSLFFFGDHLNDDDMVMIDVDNIFATDMKTLQAEVYAETKRGILKAIHEKERLRKRRRSDLMAAMIAAEKS